MSRFPEIYDPQNFQNGLIFEIYVLSRENH